MTTAQFLDVGMKLIGLYFLALSVPILLSAAVGWLFSNLWDPANSAPMKIYISISIVGVLVLMVFGWVLIRAPYFVMRYVFNEDRDRSGSRVMGTFTIGVKLFGAFLAMSEFLKFTRTLSDFSMVSSLFSDRENMAELIVELVGITTNFIPSFVSVLFGLLLFFRGELLSQWAFAEGNSVTRADSDG